VHPDSLWKRVGVAPGSAGVIFGVRGAKQPSARVALPLRFFRVIAYQRACRLGYIPRSQFSWVLSTAGAESFGDAACVRSLLPLVSGGGFFRRAEPPFRSAREDTETVQIFEVQDRYARRGARG